MSTARLTLLVIYVGVEFVLLYGNFHLYDPATGQTGIDALDEGNAVSGRGPSLSIDLDLLLAMLAVIYAGIGFAFGRWWALALALAPLAVALPIALFAPYPEGDGPVSSVATDNLFLALPCIAMGIGARQLVRRRSGVPDERGRVAST